jgi:hypothetical protein
VPEADNISNPEPEITILIATPCYSAQCHTSYTLALAKTFVFFQKFKNIKIQHRFILFDCSIPRARNHFASYVLADPSITHLLFIDADIRWQPEDIVKLLQAKKDISAATFPKKKYIWEKLRTKAVRDIVMDDSLPPEAFREKIKANLVEYAVNFGQSRDVVNGLIEVEHAATAFMLIQRSVFEKLAQAYPERKISNAGNELPENARNNLYSLFEQENVNGEYLSSDYSFCRIWHKIEGKVFVDVTINLGHYGGEEFEGNFLSLSGLKKNS